MGADVNRGERPLSPHLQVYKLPLEAVMSIMHRITGVGMALGAILIVWWFVAAASGPNSFAFIDGLMTSILGHLVLLGLTVSIMYHLMNGIRHLILDAGQALEPAQARKSGYIVLIGTGVLTVLLLIIGVAS